jgi:hypothetical protein
LVVSALLYRRDQGAAAKVLARSWDTSLAGRQIGAPMKTTRTTVVPSANKQMQRARTGYKVVLCLAHRRVADLQRYAATRGD